MTTDTQSKNTQPSDNKKIFAPLGKYAVIAVIMVSIIVTTAIMLDKQLNTIDAQFAGIEANIAQPEIGNPETAEITASSDTTTEITTAQAVAQETSTTIDTPTADVLITTEKKSETVVVAAHQNDSEQTVTTTADVSLNISSNTDATQVSPVTIAEPQQQAETRKARDAARQARIDGFKQEQKQHMAEIFARIKALESQQLDRYKTSQNNQVSNLREQIARQQQMIETLILRNQDLYQLRAASAQRNQSNREQILNRI